jgi:hypothetical protein
VDLFVEIARGMSAKGVRFGFVAIRILQRMMFVVLGMGK